MRKLLFLTLASIACFAANTHEPFDFKGDVLGETLVQFKARHEPIVATRKDLGAPAEVTFPLCTGDPVPLSFYKDATPIFVDKDEDAAKLMKCILAPPDNTIVGHPAEQTVFMFVDEKLFTINITFEHLYFNDIRGAILTKYGRPISEEEIRQQNLYGAVWSGTGMYWYREGSGIELIEFHKTRDKSRLSYLDLKLGNLFATRMKALRKLKDI